MISRRKLLASGALLSGLGLYSYTRGLRYPVLSWEPRPHPNSTQLSDGHATLKDAIIVAHNKFRAIAPEPSIHIDSVSARVQFEISNIASNAVLEITSKHVKNISEQITGLIRTIDIETSGNAELALSWKVKVKDGFEFAAIGDTGGGSELTWTLERANQLGAQFLLHLGDFNYTDGEYQAAIDAFNTAEIPTYITIGNHDFHDNGLIYQRFLNELGPMNHAFELAGTRFTNLDTAADFFPAHSGLRGKLLEGLLDQTAFQGEQVFFSHRPLKDPRPHDDHEIGGINEIEWLSQSIKNLGGKNYLHGHVHHSAELDFEGIKQFSIGEGLGHEDLVLQKQVAKILIAKVEAGVPMKHSWVDLNMPWAQHQSPTHLKKLKRDGRHKQLEWFQKSLSKHYSENG